MPEILTESFCERCGTRYTFESAAPKRRPLGRVRTLSKGLRNFVLSDETSLAEAMADARIDEEREASAQQLDAFHKTFNFCMSCRQYTCSNCWNDHDGRCLSCAPHLGTEILPAAFPDLDPHAGIAMPVAQEGSNGHLADSGWPDVDLDLDSDRLGRVFGADAGQAGIDLEHEAPVEAVAEPEVVAEGEPVGAADAAAEPEPAEVEAVAEPEPIEAVAEPEVLAEPESVSAEPEPAAADDERPPVDLLAERGLAPERPITPRTGLRRPTPPPSTADDRAAAAAAQTNALLAKFRPGQSLDEALAAYEEELARARVEEEPEPTVAAAPATASDEPPAAPPAPEPVEAQAPEPEAPPVAATPARDDIELPSWPTAPAPAPTLADRAAAQPRPVEPPAAPPPAPAAPPAQPAPPPPPPQAAPAAPASPWSLTAPVESEGEPQWPAAPQWPTPQWPAPAPTARGDRAPVAPQLAGRPLVPDRSVEALWAASSSEVLARPAGPAPSVQPCVNCGLQLSANARFCRRCGTRQG